LEVPLAAEGADEAFRGVGFPRRRISGGGHLAGLLECGFRHWSFSFVGQRKRPAPEWGQAFGEKLEVTKSLVVFLAVFCHFYSLYSLLLHYIDFRAR
jgi:hypothetical protein